MTETDQDREGRSNAVIVLEAQVDAIQDEINSLWSMDKEQKAAHEKLLATTLKQTKEALEWVKGRG